MEFFKNANIDFLGKKWYFIAFSLIFSVAGVVSLIVHHGPNWGIDFRGGTLVYVKFSHPPDDNAVRSTLDRAGLRDARLQHLVGTNELLIDLPVQETQLLDRLRPAKLNDEIRALDVTESAQPRPQRLYPIRKSGSGTETEISDPPNFGRLLRARHHRPGNQRQPGQLQQLAALHGPRLPFWRRT